jgi:hypothetical protein
MMAGVVGGHVHARRRRQADLELFQVVWRKTDRPGLVFGGFVQPTYERKSSKAVWPSPRRAAVDKEVVFIVSDS